jgi:hypothetical protein
MTFFRTTVPFSRCNNDVYLTADHRTILNKHLDNFNNQKFVDSNINGQSNDRSSEFYADFLKRSFVYLITETLGEHPYPYFTEKTWKALVTGCPFLMVNAPGSLRKLQEFGFKTFNYWWDEGYDEFEFVADRIEAVVKILKTLSKLNQAELYNLQISMADTVIHNYNHLQTFRNLELKKIANQI